MEKGHYGNYTGNARHSRKEEMIHDRELIYDAKKQLHHADQDYKSDSPAHRALVGDQNKLPGHLKKAISDAPAQMNADLAYDPVNDRADSPVNNSGLGPKTVDTPMFNLNKGYTPLKNVSGVFDKTKNLIDSSMQGMVNAAMPTSKATLGSPDTSYSDAGGINKFNLGNSITEPKQSTSTNSTDSTAKLGSGESSKEASRNLSRKKGKQARTEAKLARAEEGSKKAGRIKGKLAKTNSQIGNLESKIKNDKKPKGSGGSGGKGGSSGSGGSGSRITNNIYVNSAAKMNGSPLNNVACKYTKRK
tara:strand:+ start:681 stop:1589 length:909 start_codon:yes stop_codon:yes gene_type:complete